MNDQTNKGVDASAAARNVSAVLGPTNTGKTHLAIERMLAHKSGMIGLPLRLLAREVYNKVVAQAGADQVALITGEEKIKPDNPRYYVCTVEAMPRDVDVAFLAVDEVQLAADFDRGHVFTDRMLRMRATQETLLLGAATIRPLIENLLPGANILSRPRMSELRYSGQAKLTRLPRRSAIVAFSANEVYAIAELIRRQRGGAAVVLGALSPRTRNAQVGLYQSGEVDYLVATDAIGMGLNLDIDHVAFAADSKFDGHQFRKLNPAEIGQIAGRAGRHLNSGTFGVTARVDPFDQELIEKIEGHSFEPLKLLQWRNAELDFASMDALRASLSVTPSRPGLTRVPAVEDELAFEILSRDPEIHDLAADPSMVARLWDVCQVPDYRKIAPANHAELCASIFRFLAKDGAIPDDWFAGQLAYADRTDGDIDTLSNRIAHVRTWSFVANRPDWLRDAGHWQERTRDIEDRLSDALHECLTQRFIDRRTSVLMRRLRENTDLDLEIIDGDVRVEGQHVGHLRGFHFAPDPSSNGAADGKALRAAALKGLAGEYAARASKVAGAPDKDIILDDSGMLRWEGEIVARLAASDVLLYPRIDIICDDQLQASDKARVQERLERWLKLHVASVAEPLVQLQANDGLTGIARGIAFQLIENFGVLERKHVAEDLRNLDQDARRALRRCGVRFGAHSVFAPAMLKPAAVRLTRLIWALRNGGLISDVLDHLPQFSAQGLMSVALDQAVPRGYYAAIGFRICGKRAVRVDMLERLADQIRPLVAWKEPPQETPAPVTADMPAAPPAPSEPAAAAGTVADQTTPPPDSPESAAAGETGEAAPGQPSEPVQIAAREPVSAPMPETKPVSPPPDGALGNGRFYVTPAMMSLVGCSGEDFGEILRAIGFQQAGTMVQAQQSKRAAASGDNDTDKGEATVNVRELSIWRPRSAHPRGNSGRHAEQRGKRGQPGAAAKTEQARGGRKNRPDSAGKGKPASGRARTGNDKQQRGKRPERQPDPLSPFAALAGLKKELQAAQRENNDK